MKVLVVYAHHNPDSFTHAILDAPDLLLRSGTGVSRPFHLLVGRR